jgi:hypothetical protein
MGVSVRSGQLCICAIVTLQLLRGTTLRRAITVTWRGQCLWHPVHYHVRMWNSNCFCTKQGEHERKRTEANYSPLTYPWINLAYFSFDTVQVDSFMNVDTKTFLFFYVGVDAIANLSSLPNLQTICLQIWLEPRGSLSWRQGNTPFELYIAPAWAYNSNLAGMTTVCSLWHGITKSSSGSKNMSNTEWQVLIRPSFWWDVFPWIFKAVGELPISSYVIFTGRIVLDIYTYLSECPVGFLQNDWSWSFRVLIYSAAFCF